MSLCVGRAQAVFQFTHPGRGATSMYLALVHLVTAFQFTHPGRGAT